MADAAKQFLAPGDDAALIEWANAKREKGLKTIHRLQMKINLAYSLGYQWVAADRLGNLRRPNDTARQSGPNAPIRVTANKIGGIEERFIAELLKAVPEPEVRPVTDDDDDLENAKAGTRILKSELNRLCWESWLTRHLFWPVTQGFAYAQIVWDPKGGSKIGSVGNDDEATEPNDSEAEDAAENESNPATDVFEGQITLETVPGGELAVDPDATSMETATWAIRTKMMTVEAVWEHWGVTVEAGASTVKSISDEVAALAVSSTNTGTDSGAISKVSVNQMWMIPCRAAPKGLVVTWCGETVLEKRKPFPYNHGRIPYVQWDTLPGMGRREGRTWVDDLIPLQTDYNDARSREAEMRRKLSPMLLAPAGSIDPESVTSRVRVQTYIPGLGDKPTWNVPDSGWMNQHETSMNRSDMEMGERAGQSDVSSGKPAAASQPAAAILALQEKDNTKRAITLALLNDSIAATGLMMLELVRQFWTEERMVRTYSEEGALEIAKFSGSDISKQLDVHVLADSAALRSKSAQLEMAESLWDRKIVTNPQHILRILNFPGSDFMMESYNTDSKQAQRENEYLQLGEVVKVNVFDNHHAHITEHDNMRKSEEYDKLERRVKAGGADGMAAQKLIMNIDAHVQVHYEALGMKEPTLTPAPPAPPPAMGMPGMPPGLGTPGMPQAGTTMPAGIGAPGQPGAVPGIDPGQQAQAMGL